MYHCHMDIHDAISLTKQSPAMQQDMQLNPHDYFLPDAVVALEAMNQHIRREKHLPAELLPVMFTMAEYLRQCADYYELRLWEYLDDETELTDRQQGEAVDPERLTTRQAVNSRKKRLRDKGRRSMTGDYRRGGRRPGSATP